MSEAERELEHLQKILNERDNEIAAYNRQITELNSQLNDVERELKRRDDEIQLQRANSDAIKELCNKLDIEKEKLKEELNECSNIRRKVFVNQTSVCRIFVKYLFLRFNSLNKKTRNYEKT